MSDLFTIIPARGGSKRLLRKNLVALKDEPLIGYTIRAALAARLPNVIVATEDDEIAGVAARHGADVARVPNELTEDLVASWVPCAHVMHERGAKAEDVLLCLQPSSPLRSSQDISASIGRYRQEEHDFLVSATPIDPHYFHWALQESESGWQMYFGDRYLVERPLLPPVYRPNGAIKIARLDALERQQNFFGPSLAVYEMPEERSVHVATSFDLAVCEAVLESA